MCCQKAHWQEQEQRLNKELKMTLKINHEIQEQLLTAKVEIEQLARARSEDLSRPCL